MTIKLFWQEGNTPNINFGDSISPLIVEMISGRKVVYADLYHCDMIGIGSILDKTIRRRWKKVLRRGIHKTLVWGSGSLGPSTLSKHMNLHITALRGPFTRDGMGQADTLPLGDPGLLISHMTKAHLAPKKYRWGVIPHLVDQKRAVISEMTNTLSQSCIVDLADPDLQATLDKIASCDFIISSSLHGLITADALGIPNIWMRLGGDVHGGDWKFHDYFASVGRELISPLLPRDEATLPREEMAVCAQSAIIAQRQDDLYKAFRNTGLGREI